MSLFRKRYYSSARLLFASLLLILLLFMLLSLLFYHRLQQAQQIVEDVAEHAVPAVLEASQVHEKVKELNLQSELLRDAVSQAARARASQQISQIIVQISSLDHQQYVQHQYQQQRLQLIADEARSLDMLIAERLVLQQRNRQWLEKLTELQQLNQRLSQQLIHSPASQRWLLAYAGLLQQVTALYSIDRLYNLRQSRTELLNQLSVNQQLLSQLSEQNQLDARPLTEQLSTVLLSDQGILALREAELSNIARATGKANFLRTLVTDYASETELNAYQSAASLMQLSQQSSSALQRQNQYSFALAIAAIVLLIAIMLYTQKRVIKRLKLLNEKVQAGGNFAGDDRLFTSNDEIADIARSFTQYSNTVAAQQTALERQSLTDGLTGIANRRHFDSQLRSAVAMAKRMQQPLALILLDVDHFKAYNDSYGHLAGDDTLKAIANTLSDTLQRQIDMVARYGGEEFACILPNTGPEQAMIMAEQLRLEVLALMLPHHASPTAGFITISLGVSCLLPGQDINDNILLNQADKALYQAKTEGRNCAVLG